MIKLKESYGDLSDYLERHLDSWYGRLNELGDAIEDLGLDVDEINNEYVIVHAAEPDGEDVYCKIRLGGTPRTISLETFEMLESVRRSKKAISEFYRYSYDNQRISNILDKIEQTNDQKKIDKAYDFINRACDNIDDCMETGFYDLSDASWGYGTDYIIEELTDILNESYKRKNGKVLRESDDKITARSFQELISKLENHGYSCEHYYDMKYPESNWLYITKNGDPYEAEFYRYDDGEYELYLHNIHPTKEKNEGCYNIKSMKESYSDIDYDNLWEAYDIAAGVLGYEELCMSLAKAMGDDELMNNLKYIFRTWDIPFMDEDEEDYGLDDYDECLDEANVVGMGGGYPNAYLPKAAKEYLKRKGFQEVNTEIGPCFYMGFTGNDFWEIYIDEQYGGIYVVQEGYELRPTDDIATIDDYDYRDDIDAVINLGNCLSNGEDFDSCLKTFFN